MPGTTQARARRFERPRRIAPRRENTGRKGYFVRYDANAAGHCRSRLRNVLLVEVVRDIDCIDLLTRHVSQRVIHVDARAQKEIEEVRVDRYERELQPNALGMASFRPAWKGAAFEAALATVPLAQRQAAAEAYLRDPRDTATPRGMIVFLSRLDAGELLSPASTRRLVTIMASSPRGPERLKAGLPQGVFFTHKIGTGRSFGGRTSAYNDVGIFTLADKRSYAIAAFLTASTADEGARAALLADLGRAAMRAVG